MSLTAKIAGLSVVTVPVVGLSQIHWIVSHFSTIATGAAALTVGAGVWGGHALIGKVKTGLGKGKQAAAVESAQQQSQPQALTQGQPTAAEAQAYLQGIREALLTKQAEPSTSQRKVIDLGQV